MIVPEASGCLVAPLVFKISVRRAASQAGSIPVRLRHPHVPWPGAAGHDLAPGGRNSGGGGGVARVMISDAFADLLGQRKRGVVVTLRKDGRPQLSNVTYAWFPGEQLIRVSVTDDRAKVKNLRRDPRVSFHVTSDDFWSYAVVDGVAELSPVAADPFDPTVEELVNLYRTIVGDHPDWDDYRAAMVRDRRLVLRIRPDHAYGLVRGA